MNRKVFIALGALVILLASSTLTILISDPVETEESEDPSHSATDRKPPISPTVSAEELMTRAPLAPPKAVKAIVAIGTKALTQYRIKPGDTLGTLAKAWHMSASKLACINGIKNPNIIFPGKLIKKNGTQKCVAAIRPTAQRTIPGRSSSNVETVISFAMAQLGEPYVYGAAGPSSWDCSGLVSVAFGQVGIQLPHFTGAMIGHGTPVSQSAMQRGDIVFPSSGHVGIYLGGGKYINAPQSGDVVKVADVYAFYAARRIL